jgi:hypothetical protein
MVAITGSLAMNNVSEPRDDIDLLLVTVPGRVWLARGLSILVVHLAEQFDIELCPNYVMSEHDLNLGEPSIYTAHELAQLTPVSGPATYHKLLESNDWMARFLPNAAPMAAASLGPGPAGRAAQRALEAVLGGGLGDRLEQRERERKIPRLRRIAQEKGSEGTVYAPDLCKGHANDHAAAVHRSYEARLAARGL